ncbi:nucleotidyltransferase family protein [Sanguibacter sp. 25GB23B1]|uniref:nucleotidyltransferase family protein n=1 Tax=unclassified Sanguibacter TaxID=2645534 RepID=UPI0032AEF3A8
MSVAGLVLAAGGGRRMGRPKALLDTDGESWLELAVSVLESAGCGPVLVTLGAEADAARPLVPPAASVVEVTAWESGMGESLRQGLDAVGRLVPDADAVVVTLVDLPRLRAGAVARVVDAGGARGARRTALVQAHYDGRPGHPVLIGREHWAPLRDTLHGDAGARGYLRAHAALAVDCTDLGGGDDVDTRE